MRVVRPDHARLVEPVFKQEQLPSGKVITRQFGQDGSLVEESHVYGLLDIGIKYVFREGRKIEETYFCRKRLVSRQTYEKARPKYADMPAPDEKSDDWGAALLKRMANESQQHRTEAKHHLPNLQEGQENDTFCRQVMEDGTRKNASTWIKNKAHTLGERNWSGSKRLVDRLLALGCPRVWACQIDIYEDSSENTGHLVLELPKTTVARRKVLSLVDRLAREMGYEGPFDDGQQYAYVKLD